MGWGAPANFVDQTPDGAPALLPDAVAAGDCIFALATQATSPDITAIGDPVNGPYTLIGKANTGGTADRRGFLYCFLGSAAALASTLLISVTGGDGATNLYCWTHTPPAGTKILTLDSPLANGGAGATMDAGTIVAAKTALLVCGGRMRPNSGQRPVVPGTDFTLVDGQGAGYLQAEYALDMPPASYDAFMTANISLDGWVALAAAIYAQPGIVQRRTSSTPRAGTRQASS